MYNAIKCEFVAFKHVKHVFLIQHYKKTVIQAKKFKIFVAEHKAV